MPPLILIVEDEPQLAEVLEAYARQQGFQTARVGDGVKALHAFHALHPDLILLDLMLPGLSGLDVLRAVRAESAVPVMLLTALGEPEEKLDDLAVTDIVQKPYRPREVIRRVKSLLGLGGLAAT